MSEKSENKNFYPIPQLRDEYETDKDLLFYKFADALIEEQSICGNMQGGGYMRLLECMKSKQRLVKAYNNHLRNSMSSKYEMKKMLTLKKIIDVNPQKQL